ncbi:hypothetical protein ACI65C_004014 [Semiaphis heraclei]
MFQLKRAFEEYNKSLKGIIPEENENEQSNSKLFCPNSMVKYHNRALDDNTSESLSVTKSCVMNVFLNKEAASSSSNYCIQSGKNPPARNFMKIQKTWTLQKTIKKYTKAPRAPKNPKTQTRPVVSPDPYICTCCNLAFRRKVTYDQHIKEQQRKSSSSVISISSSDESESPQMKRSVRKKKSEIKDPTYCPDDY